MKQTIKQNLQTSKAINDKRVIINVKAYYTPFFFILGYTKRDWHDCVQKRGEFLKRWRVGMFIHITYITYSSL